MSKDLRSFLKEVKEAGSDYYVEIERELSTKYEPCVIQQKLAKENKYPVIYCKNMSGSDLPLVTNIYGSYELLGMTLGLPAKTSKNEIIKEYMSRVSNPLPLQKVSKESSPVKEIVLTGGDVDLNQIPIVHHAEYDSGKYIVVGCMIVKDPDTGVPNVGMYRHELKGPNTIGAMINPAHHGSYIARRYKELNKPMEVVLFVGHHPAAVLGSLVRGDLDVNELEAMGGLLGEPLAVTDGETVDLPVPAFAEIVIEGVIDPNKEITDGPFGEYTGYYGEGGKSALQIDVKAITMRKDAIYHDLDPAHREHNLAGVLCFESVMYEAAKKAVPSVIAVHLPTSACCLYTAYISLKKRIQGEGKLAALAALGSEANLKTVVLVDDDIDVYNEQEVLWAVATRVQADQDLSVIAGATGAHLDPSAYNETRFGRGHMTSKVIIDATKPIDLPFAKRITPPEDVWSKINLKDYVDSTTKRGISPTTKATI